MVTALWLVPTTAFGGAYTLVSASANYALSSEILFNYFNANGTIGPQQTVLGPVYYDSESCTGTTCTGTYGFLTQVVLFTVVAPWRAPQQ